MIDEDIKFGLDLEFEHYELVKNKFDKSLEKNTYKYALFDYIGDKCFIELKSRRNASTKYKDTMIGCNKLLFARNCAKEVYFVFAFTDGLFYYKFSKEDYDTGIIRSAYGGRDDRGKDEQKPYCYVPIKLLTRF
jgi:hypothetical protein